MNQGHQDPSVQWAAQLARIDGARREAVAAALRHSDATGWPASAQAVELLVSYASGAISSRDYAAGILADLGAGWREEPARAAYAAAIDDLSGPSAPAVAAREAAPEPSAGSPAAASGLISREDAVHAYVTGQIPVGEFLRLARS